jgi:hypothetical protein
VAFNFDWPEGIVRFSTIEKRRTSDGADREVRYGFDVSVEKDEQGGYLLTPSNFAVHSVRGTFGKMADVTPMRAMLGRLRVDAQGQLLEVEDVSFTKAAGQALAEAKRKAGAPSDPANQKLLDSMLQPDALRAAVNNSWRELTLELGGYAMELNAPQQSVSRAPLPLPGTPEIELTMTQLTTYPKACGGTRKSGCAVVAIESQPNPGMFPTLEKTMSELLQRPVKVNSMVMTQTVELHLEPATTRPYSKTKTTRPT